MKMNDIDHDDRQPVRITLPRDELIRDPHYLQLLAIVMWCIRRGTKYVSRRTLIDVPADVFCRERVELLTADGEPFPIPDLDDLFEPAGYDEEEKRFESGHDFEWCGAFMKNAIQPPLYPAQDRVLDRIRVIHAAIVAGGPWLWRNLDHKTCDKCRVRER
ncbi:hypothetical protein [Maricaulis virginensis]|uniref:Uncharacterized protein n=1 Tax=Maricaulis virginensis TaxID=144022 RepID=A0A9W6IIE6_9PROT|nr:hypothetical protein [Maricaulis virginensis]GLK50513.1 hypothetical protein GCM10017621_00210 [Maricaulis virginensis]